MIVSECIGLALYLFTVYLLWGSIQLMRRFVDETSTRHNNERTAWLHIIMVMLMLVTSLFHWLCGLNHYIRALMNDKGPESETGLDLLLISRIVRSVGGFFALMILLYMFWGYGLNFKEKCRQKNSRKKETVST